MRKIYFFAAFAATALASCSNDEVVRENLPEGIAFDVKVQGKTRAAEITTANLDSFKVSAFKDEMTGARFEEKVTKKADNKWFPENSQYWQQGETLKFFAYAPVKTAGTATTLDVPGVLSMSKDAQTLTACAPNLKTSNQKDFVVAYNTGNQADNSTTGVNLNFKHAFSQIEVKAKNDGSKFKVEIIGMKVVNPAAKADFTFPNAKTDNNYSLDGKWSNWSEKDSHDKSYMVMDVQWQTQKVTLTAEPQSLMFGKGNMMLLPQTFATWNPKATGEGLKKGVYISVLCRVYNKDNGKLLYPQPTETDAKDNKYAFAAIGINAGADGQIWKAGKKYIYTLDFSRGAGYVDPNPTIPPGVDPNVPTPNPVTPPVINPGQPTVGEPIFFTVDVQPWTEVTVGVNM